MSSVAFTPEHDKVVRRFALKAWRRAQAAGARSLQLEDVKQELMLTWCTARNKWREEYGVPFLAYLQNGMRKAINRWLQSQIDFGHVASIDFEDDEEGRSAHETLADEQAQTPFEVFERDDERMMVLDWMTPKTRQFVELLMDPPQFLLDGVRALRSRQTFARDQSLPATQVPNRVTAAMVMEFLELSPLERGAIYAELKSVSYE